MKNKWAVIGNVILVIFVALFVSSCDKKGKQVQQKRENKGTPVIIAPVESKSIDYVLYQVGTLAAAQEVMIRTEASGKVLDILFNEGTAVKKGDLLVRLDDAKIKTEIQSLQAKVGQLETRLKNREKSLERNRVLVKQNLVSQDRFDDMLTEIDEIKSQIVQTQASLNRMKETLADTVIRSPFDGICGPRNFSIGHYLRVGDPVVSIVNLNVLEIEFRVPEKYKKSLFDGQNVKLKVDAYPEKTFAGKIFFIDPEVSVGTRTFLVKARVDNTQQFLNPGMFARAELITEVHPNAVVVPWESVIQTEDETYVYTTDGKTAKKHAIVMGMVADSQVELLGTDISPGENVITEGKFAAKDGGPVDICEKNEACRPEAEKTIKTQTNPNE